jgi:hypothetical protein
MVESMYEQLMDGHTAAAADLLPSASNKDGGPKRGNDSKGALGLSFRFAAKDYAAGAADATAW